MGDETALDAITTVHEVVCPKVERFVKAAASDSVIPDTGDDWAPGDVSDVATEYSLRWSSLLIAREMFTEITGQEPPEPLPEPFDQFQPDWVPHGLTTNIVSQADNPGPRMIGAMYEATVSISERDDRGQFFTPPRIVDSLVNWAVPEPTGQVLDPAVGTGRFLAAAARKLGGSKRGGKTRLIGVDVDPTAVYFARLRLMADTTGIPLTCRAASFFDLEPEQIGRIDAVVGNPPYLRAETMDSGVRDHLQEFGADESTPYLDGEKRLSKRCDAYVYFVTQATRHLRPGGRLAMILPSKWLNSAYGEGFQQFLFDHYRVHAVIGFETKVFDDALVDTCLLFAERSTNEGPTRFAQLRHPADLKNNGPLPGVPESQQVRSTVHRQSNLEPGNLARYFRAPPELLEVIDRSSMVQLGDLADVSRGVMTGANQVFFLEEHDAAQWNIDDRFLRPALKSMRSITDPVFRSDDGELSIVDVHDYVVRTGAETRDEVIASLRRDGYTGLVEYLEFAEANGWNAGRTCQSRKVWFDLGDLPVPDAFVPKLLRERVFVIENEAEAVPSNAIDCLTVTGDVDATALLGVLNSTLGQAGMEIWGRDEAGMLQLMTYETASLPVPDIRALDRQEVDRLRRNTRVFFDNGDRELLDSTVVEIFGVDLSVERLRTLRNTMLSNRVATT